MKNFHRAYRSLSVIVLCLIITEITYGQVGINPAGSPPHSSAGLDVDFSNRGLLIPRMSSAQRDAISNPAEGLKIYNTDTKCENYFNGTFWYELCGVCVPQPSASNAGPDQSVQATSVTLSANTPLTGNGSWSIVSGIGGTVISPTNPASTFSGQLGQTYMLRWTISTPCASSYDDVTITLTYPTKRVFITSVTTTGNFGGLSGADNFCQSRATASGVSGTYVAWLSTPTVNAKDRVNSGSTFIRLDGEVIAHSISDLTDGSIENPINVADDGSTLSDELVYTGSTSAGVLITSIYPGYLSGHCNNWTCACEGGATHLAGTGRSAGTDGTWTQAESVVGYGCSNNFRLYCFEQ